MKYKLIIIISFLILVVYSKLVNSKQDKCNFLSSFLFQNCNIFIIFIDVETLNFTICDEFVTMTISFLYLTTKLVIQTARLEK